MNIVLNEDGNDLGRIRGQEYLYLLQGVDGRFEGCEVVTHASKGMAEPHIAQKIIHVQHQASHSIIELIRDAVFLIVEGDSWNSCVRGLAHNGKCIVGC